MKGCFIADVAWPEVEVRLARGAHAVLPIGAAAKEHGRHLPLATDYLQAQWLAQAVADVRDVAIWPTLSYGYYPVFVDYPGSVSLGRATFIAVLDEILHCMVQAGAQRIAVLNTGISTIAPCAEVLAARATTPPARLVNVYSGARLARARAAIEEQSWGGHADEMETSLMLAIDPESVDMAQATPAPVRFDHGRFNRCDPDAPNYSPSGATGDPTRASRAKGERLLAALLDDVLEALDSD